MPTTRPHTLLNHQGAYVAEPRPGQLYFHNVGLGATCVELDLERRSLRTVPATPVAFSDVREIFISRAWEVRSVDRLYRLELRTVSGRRLKLCYGVGDELKSLAARLSDHGMPVLTEAAGWRAWLGLAPARPQGKRMRNTRGK